MDQLYFAYPGDLNTPTGGYGYDRRVMAGLRALGWQVEPVALGEGFPGPSKATLDTARQRLEGLPENGLVVIDGLAFGAMPCVTEGLQDRLRLVALVHHPLCLENGVSPAQAMMLKANESAALSFARHIIVTSPATASQVVELFAIASDSLSVIVPGTDKQMQVEREQVGYPKLLSVGTVVPRKGYDLLFKALAGLSNEAWHLDVVGGTNADPACFENLQILVRDLDLADRITFHGAVQPDALARYYQAADVFVLASRYEGYGMAYTEALAHGLPVIGSGGGAVRDTLPHEAALYCGIEDVSALQDALKVLITDPARRAEMAGAARAAAAELPDWTDTSRLFSKVLREIGT